MSDLDFDRDDRFDDEREPPRRRRYNCGGWSNYNGPCGAPDCASCYPGGSHSDEPEECEATRTKYVTARKPRHVGFSDEIRPGDRVRVVSGFTYQPDGPRTGYLRKQYFRVSKGPAWESTPTA